MIADDNVMLIERLFDAFSRGDAGSILAARTARFLTRWRLS